MRPGTNQTHIDHVAQAGKKDRFVSVRIFHPLARKETRARGGGLVRFGLIGSLQNGWMVGPWAAG